MMIWPKYSSSPSILTRRSIASLMDSSRPLCTLTTYQRLLFGGDGSGSLASAVGGSGGGGGAAPCSSCEPSWASVDSAAGVASEACPSSSDGWSSPCVCASKVARSSGICHALQLKNRPEPVPIFTSSPVEPVFRLLLDQAFPVLLQLPELFACLRRLLGVLGLFRGAQFRFLLRDLAIDQTR